MTQIIYSALPRPSRPLVCVPSVVSLSQCIDMMIKQDIGALVVRDGETTLGILSERDIVRSCLHPDFDIYKSTAGDVAYTDFSILNIDDPLEEAMEVITTTKRRHILVAEKGELVAILSIGDILFYVLEDKTRVIEQLENYIHTY
ncbi:MAG: CBS domain-containing protein [Tatlockia sp.]|nr:CBS domain-containing protein [Tatlockia sp.]